MPRSLLATALFLAGASIPTASFAAFDAAGYYQMRCATCHGAEGQGTRASVPPLAPALKGNPFVVNGSPAAIDFQARITFFLPVIVLIAAGRP